MRKKVAGKQTSTIAIIVIVVAILGSTIFVVTRPNKAEKKNDAATSSQTSPNAQQQTAPSAGETSNAAQTPSQAPSTAPTAGVYADYTEAAFKDAVNRRRVLFFYAQWCPQCRAIESDIKSGAIIPAGITIFKVNYDNAQGLRQKYGVTMQTTIVEVDGSGNLKKKYVAYDEPNLNAILNAIGR